MTATLTRTQRWEHHLSQRYPLHRIILKFTTRRLYNIRNDFAFHYIKEKGYEIGAQNSPLLCEKADKIQYIDYLSKKESSEKYNIPIQECVDVDIIADANDLDHIPTKSTSFIIANHVLEHSPNPIHALCGWLRILRTDGILFLTLPNYSSNEFDFEKPPTQLSHFIEDYQKSKRKEDITTVHIHEHVRIIDGVDPQNHIRFKEICDKLVQSNLHTHYHVFNKQNCIELLAHIHQHIPIKVQNYYALKNGFELLFIIQKCPENNLIPFSIKKNYLLNFVIISKNFIKLLLLKFFHTKQ